MDIALPYLPIAGCFLVGFFFAFFGVWNTYHWRPTLAFMQQKKIPFSFPLLILGILIQTIAGLMLMLGIYIKLAALVLIPFDIIAVFIFHAFWNCKGEIRRLNMIIFITNLTASLGALLLLLNSIQPISDIWIVFN
jgi:putative oxidoreductase